MERTKKNYTIQLALQAFKSTGYLTVNKVLIGSFGLLPAFVLSNYIDKYIYFSQKKDFDGSFFLRHTDVMEQLHLKENTVIRIKKELIKHGVLQVSMKGLPAKEYLSINFDVLISKGLASHQDGGLLSQQDGGLTYIFKENKDKENKLLDINTSSNGKKITPLQKRTEKYIPLAEKLAEVISSKKRINIQSNQIKEWANDIRKLSEIEGVEMNRIRKILRWYKSAIGGKFIPVVESGYSFREKFIKLEDAKEREKTSTRSDKPANVFHDGLERDYDKNAIQL